MTSHGHTREAPRSHPEDPTRAGSTRRTPFPVAIAIMALAVFVPIALGLRDGGLRTFSYAAIAVIVLLLLVGVGRRPRYAELWVIFAVAAAAAGVTSSGRSGLSAALPEGLAIAVLSAFGVFAARGVVARYPGSPRLVCYAFVLSQTFSAAYGVLQTTGLLIGDYTTVNGRSTGFAGHPNILGLMSGIVIALCLHAIVSRLGRPKGLVPAAVGLLAINVAALIASGSTSSMIATTLGVLVIVAGSRVSLGRAITLVTIVIAGAIAFAVSPLAEAAFTNPLDRLAQVTGQAGGAATFLDRINTVVYALDYIATEPFLGRGMSDLDAPSWNNVFVHNLPVRAWYQGGIVFGAATVALYIAVALVAVRAIRTSRDVAAAATLVAIFGFAFTSAMWSQVYYWLPVVFAWGTLGRIGGELGDKPRGLPDGSRSRRHQLFTST